jgi:hypothetical protein
MNIVRPFVFVFEDTDWVKKLLIGAVLTITGIGWILVLGYAVEVARRAALQDPHPLPEWDDLGRKIGRGLGVVVMGLVMVVPLLILFGIYMAVFVPLAGDLWNQNADTATIDTVLGGSMVVVVAIILGYACLTIPVMPAMIGRFAVTGNLLSIFQVRQILGTVGRNLGAYLVMIPITLIAGALGALGAIALGCGIFFTMVYAQLVTYYAYGQAYQKEVDAAPAEPMVADAYYY